MRRVISIISIFLLYAVTSNGFSQKITNFIMIGPNGVTEDAATATSFIVVKEFPDNHFERSDYKKGAPMTKLRTYKNSDMKILDGIYCEYFSNGSIGKFGRYKDDKKEGAWLGFDETGKLTSEYMYESDSLIQIVDIHRKEKKDTVTGKEATFPGGSKAWGNYITNSLSSLNTADKAISEQGGIVIVNFTIDTSGKVCEIFISKSAEYILDDESLLIIRKSPPWKPAMRGSDRIKAYRRQPITFGGREE